VKLNKLSPAGVVPEPPGEGEAAEEGRGAAALGPVLPQHEALPGQLQVGQGQHPGGGPGQRRGGLLHRYAPRLFIPSRAVGLAGKVGLTTQGPKFVFIWIYFLQSN